MRAWPWAINREGKGYWFDTRDEALAFAQESLARGPHELRRRLRADQLPLARPRLSRRSRTMFDPEWTATYAAQFLRTLYEERGSWSAAAGAYHSLSPGARRRSTAPASTGCSPASTRAR